MTQESRLVIVIDSRNAERNARNLSDELNSIERNGDFATRSIDRLSVATRQLAGYIAGLVTIGTAVSKMDTYTGLQNKLKLVTDSQIALNKAMQDTFKIAQNTGQAWESVSQIYQRFSDNAKRLNLNQAKTAELTDTVSKAIAISGGSASSAEAALIQFSQALASNVLRGEELNSVMEQAPGLAKAIAQGMGITVGQLRSVAAEGKITGDVLVDALGKAKASVDDLFGKTDFTIANSFTQLSNAITKFVGEAGSGSGAAQAISASLSGLAKNLETVTNIAMIGGAYWVGTLIPVMYKSVVASGAKVKALFEEIQATNAAIVQIQRKAQAEFNAAQAEMSSARAAVLAAEIEVNANRAVIQSEIQRMQATIAATNAEKAQEAQRLKSQITDQGRAMSISRMATLQQTQALMTAELTALEQRLASTTVASSAAYTSARNAQTAATGRLTAATSGLNVANSLTTRSTFGLLGALGGPVGLGLTVAGVAASYLLLRDNTEKATKSLNEQGKTIDEIIKKYRELDEAQKRSQLRVETTSLSELTKKYREASDTLFKYTINIEKYGYVSAEASEKIGALALQYEQGKISASTLASKVNALTGVSEKAKAKIDEQTGVVAKLRNELQLQKNVTEEMISQSKRSTQSTDAETKAINAKRIAQEMLTTAQKTASSENLKNQFLINTIQRNGSNKSAVDFANFMASFREANKIPFSETLSAEMLKVAQAQYAIEQQRKKLIDGITDSEKDRTKELEKQLKVLQVNAKVQANASKYNFGGLENKYGLPSGMLSAIHMIESRGNTKAYNKDTGASGGFQFLSGTAKQYGVKDRFDLGQSAEGAAKYLQYLLKLFNGNVEKAVRAYHAGEGNVQKGKNLGKYNNQYIKDYYGYMGGAIGYSGDEKDFISLMNDQVKERQKTLAEIKQLQAQFDTETIARSKARDEQIEMATALGQKQLIPEIKLRYETQEKIAKLQLDNELNGYKWTEEQKLEFSKQINILRLDAEGKLSDDQKAIAKKAYDEGYSYQAGLIKLASEQRIFQANQVMYSEMDRIKKRYEFERLEIMKNLDLKERSALLAASYINQSQEESKLRDSAIGDYRSVMGLENSPLVEQFKIIDKLREIDLGNEKIYQEAKLQLQAKYTSSYLSGMFGGFAVLVDENSKTYAVLFAAQKAFAVAQAMLNIPQAYSKAYDAVVGTPYIGPYIAPAIGAAAAALQVVQAASIKNISMPGYYKGGLHSGSGYVRGAGSTTSDSINAYLSDKEFVTNAWATDKIGLANMRYMNRTGELPPNREEAQLSAIQRQQRQTDLINTSISQRNTGAIQNAVPTVVDNQMKVVILDDRSAVEQELMGPSGEKAFLYHWNRNKSKLR
ncbi:MULTISPECIES: tape measure protein [Acinetobacter]|uniref:Uncharacterized protein n=1 Tax=Acinetobacter higginsii TaxID=70347 RepID=N9SU14_9GAMM|nr:MULTISPECIES: tape measure protein [Acinetobacter]ENX58151.1 hypothetical protein F902_02551 [Acinetobacter higginsii]